MVYSVYECTLYYVLRFQTAENTHSRAKLIYSEVIGIL